MKNKMRKSFKYSPRSQKLRFVNWYFGFSIEEYSYFCKKKFIDYFFLSRIFKKFPKEKIHLASSILSISITYFYRFLSFFLSWKIKIFANIFSIIPKKRKTTFLTTILLFWKDSFVFIKISKLYDIPKQTARLE